MTILIEDLNFDTILGILEHERVSAQRIRIDCSLSYTYASGHFLNYAEIAEHIMTTMHREKFELIEDAIETLAASLKSTFPAIDTLSLSIRKPDILSHCTVGVQSNYDFRR